MPHGQLVNIEVKRKNIGKCYRIQTKKRQNLNRAKHILHNDSNLNIRDSSGTLPVERNYSSQFLIDYVFLLIDIVFVFSAITKKDSLSASS